MANRYYASIEIGGSVTVEQLHQIIERVQEEDPESIYVPPAVLPHLKEMQGWPKSFVGFPGTMLVCGMVRWGEFEALESYLQAQGIPYDRFTEPVGNENGTLVRFRPETGVREYPATASGELFVDAGALERAIAETQTRDDLIAWLRRHMGADIPELPPLTVATPEEVVARSERAGTEAPAGA